MAESEGNTMRLITLDSIVRQVLPQTLPAPRSMVEDTIRYMARDFFEKSEVWEEYFQEAVGYGESSVVLSPPANTRIARVMDVWLDSNKLYPGEYEVPGRDEIYFRHAAPHPYVATVRVALKPSRFANELPEPFVEEYGDTIAYGALARLKAMSGKGVEWTDANGAALALQLYNEGVAKARVRAIHAKRGGDILAVGQEYIV